MLWQHVVRERERWEWLKTSEAKQPICVCAIWFLKGNKILKIRFTAPSIEPTRIGVGYFASYDCRHTHTHIASFNFFVFVSLSFASAAASFSSVQFSRFFPSCISLTSFNQLAVAIRSIREDHWSVSVSFFYAHEGAKSKLHTDLLVRTREQSKRSFTCERRIKNVSNTRTSSRYIHWNKCVRYSFFYVFRLLHLRLFILDSDSWTMRAPCAAQFTQKCTAHRVYIRTNIIHIDFCLRLPCTAPLLLICRCHRLPFSFVFDLILSCPFHGDEREHEHTELNRYCRV